MTDPSAPEAAAAPPPHRPLDGHLVVDLSRYLPGPLVSRILGDLGARVIKVEEPSTGDPVRDAPPQVEGQSGLATLLLAGHESLALDLKKQPAREALERLLERADVLVESFRPGVLARFGLAPEELRRRFPKLVICSLTGWGQDGPHAHRAGHDLGYQAIAGSLAAADGMPAGQTADVVGAWSGAASVLAALVRRGVSGEGCWIDQALLDAAGHSAITTWAAEADGPKAAGEPLMLTGALPCYNLYPTRDGGRLALATLEPRFWRGFCRAVGRDDLILRQLSTDPEAHREVAAVVAQRSAAEWAELMREHDLPGEPVLAASEALGHPQVEARDLLRDAADGLPRLGFPARLDGQRPRGAEAFPELGEHTESLVREFGLAEGHPPLARWAGGIGRRFSLKRWALGVASKLGSGG